jgi:hypothetical protein
MTPPTRSSATICSFPGFSTLRRERIMSATMVRITTTTTHITMWSGIGLCGSSLNPTDRAIDATIGPNIWFTTWTIQSSCSSFPMRRTAR